MKQINVDAEAAYKMITTPFIKSGDKTPAFQMLDSDGIVIHELKYKQNKRGRKMKEKKSPKKDTTNDRLADIEFSIATLATDVRTLKKMLNEVYNSSLNIQAELRLQKQQKKKGFFSWLE